MADPDDRAQSWAALLKRRRSVALLLFTATLAAGLAGFMDSAGKIADRVQLLMARPRIISFALSPTAAGFHEERLPSLTPLRYDDLRSFSPDDHALGHRAVFIVTVDNPRRTDLILTELAIDVEATGYYAGAGAGPLEPLATYRHELRFATGRQTRPLVPPFRVPATSAASLDLAVSPLDPASFPTDTPVWIMTIGLTGGGYTVRTDRFQLLMSVASARSYGAASGGRAP